ncbi:MAG: hypothetical protein ACLUFP_01290 [Streptococcus salivarius]
MTKNMRMSVLAYDKMDLGDRLLFTGLNIREYMKKIDFTLLTSLSEGLPLSFWNQWRLVVLCDDRCRMLSRIARRS